VYHWTDLVEQEVGGIFTFDLASSFGRRASSFVVGKISERLAHSLDHFLKADASQGLEPMVKP
jgi:hypothetical protein